MKSIEVVSRSYLQEYYEYIGKSDYNAKEVLGNIHRTPKLGSITLYIGVRKNSSLMFSYSLLEILSGRHFHTKKKKEKKYFSQKSDYNIIKVKLTDRYMSTFFDRFVSIILPNIRNFKGITNKSFNKFGACFIQLEDLAIFPELKQHLNILDFLLDYNYQFVVEINTNCKKISSSTLLMSGFNVPIIYEN